MNINECWPRFETVPVGTVPVPTVTMNKSCQLVLQHNMQQIVMQYNMPVKNKEKGMILRENWDDTDMAGI